MNTDTEGVTLHYRRDCKVLEVETRKAKYQGHAWRSLGDFYKRKFENAIFIKASADKRIPDAPIKVIYK